MRVGSFFPDQAATSLFAMAGDDCSLHFDMEDLTLGQRADHVTNVVLTGNLQVALHYIGNPADHVGMYRQFSEPRWTAALDALCAIYGEMGLDPIRAENRHFVAEDTFYADLARQLPDVELVNLYMTSVSNQPLHQDAAALAVSRNVNSKFHFAVHAPVAGIPTPETLVTTKAGLASSDVAEFLARHDNALMLKTLGLAGARNVTAVASLGDIESRLAEFDGDLDVLLQARLDTSEWQEMTADLRVSSGGIELSNVRQILFADGLWVGNRIGTGVEASAAHLEVLNQVGRYARDQGYVTAEGSNCGVDYFVRGDEVMVTEINARWTGGLFPAEMIRRAGLQDQVVVAFFDVVPAEGFEDWVAFQQRHFRGDGRFRAIPLGFGPHPQEMEGATMHFVWQLVAGDFEAFVATKQQELAPGSLPTADVIRL